MELAELSALAKRYHLGEVSEEELARTLQKISSSVSFQSMIESFERLYGDPFPRWSDGYVPISSLDATQICLEYAKLHLVRWLFADPQDFERLNATYFPTHPLTTLRMRNGRFAILDGHHRLWQAGILFGRNGSVKVRIVTSRNPQLLTSFRNEVRRVAEANESAELRRLPIRDKPSETAIIRLMGGIRNPRWLLAGPWTPYQPSESQQDTASDTPTDAGDSE